MQSIDQGHREHPAVDPALIPFRSKLKTGEIGGHDKKPLYLLGETVGGSAGIQGLSNCT